MTAESVVELLYLFVLMGCAMQLGAIAGVTYCQIRAVKAGVARFNRETGQFEWIKDNSESEEVK